MKCPTCGHECTTSTCPVCNTKIKQLPRYSSAPKKPVSRTNNNKPSFQASKTIAFRLKIDEKNKRFAIEDKVFNYDDLIDFELIEDSGEGKKQGLVKRSVAGWAIFGAAGAVIGGSTAKSSRICTALYIRVRLRNSIKSIVDIYFIGSEANSGETDKSSDFYHTAKKRALECMSALQQIANENESRKIEETEQRNSAEDQPAPAPFSAADEILKFKNLADAGIITQEEFEQKKQQLLGL